jgi:Tol biopolymer transport system component
LVVEMMRGWIPCRLVPFDGSSSGRQVGPAPAQCTAAAWSPDGKWMYFTASAGQGFHLWRQLADGGKPEQLTFGPSQELGVTVSPDGRSIYAGAGSGLESVWIHDSKGDRQVSAEGWATNPVLSADGKKVYYAVTQHGGDPSAELWVADLQAGRSEPALPGVRVLARNWSVTPDAKTVAYQDEKSNLWIAPLDRSSSPRKFSMSQTQGIDFDNFGHIFYAVQEGAEYYLYRMNLDGSDRRKAFERPLVTPNEVVSPDGRWLAHQSKDRIVVVQPLSGGDQVAACVRCTPAWAPDGASLLLHFRSLMGERDMTAIIPLRGGELPRFPPLGLLGVEDAGKLPGAVVFPSVSQGSAAGSAYVYDRLVLQGNLFRITLP